MKFSLLLGLITLGCNAATAHADLSYTQTTSSPFSAMMGGAGGPSTRTFYKGGAMRMEMNMMGTKTIMLTGGANGSTTQIDPVSKTYTVSNGMPKMPTGVRRNMGATELTVSVRKLGFANVRGVRAPHWIVDMAMKMSSPQGTRTMKMGTEVWSSTTPIPTVPGAGQTALKKLPANLTAMFGNNIKIKGDIKNMGAAYATVPLRMKILMNGQTFATTETTDISTKTLPASLFTVPAGYKQVTPAQFSQRQQQAMRQKMNGMFKGMPGMPQH